MHRLVSIVLDVIAVAIFIVPVVIIAQQLYFRQRTLLQKVITILFSLYIAAIFSAVGIPDIRSLVFDPSINMIPFIDVVDYPYGYIRNQTLNILMFIPLGAMLSIVFKNTRIKFVILFAAGLSIIIEILQLFTFRLTDIDDLITNVTGAIVGFYMSKFLIRKMPKLSCISNECIYGKIEIVFLFIFVYLVEFFILPFLR